MLLAGFAESRGMIAGRARDRGDSPFLHPCPADGSIAARLPSPPGTKARQRLSSVLNGDTETWPCLLREPPSGASGRCCRSPPTTRAISAGSG